MTTEPMTTEERIEFETREAKRWGLPLAEYLIMRLDHARNGAGDNVNFYAQQASKGHHYKMAFEDERRLRLATMSMYEREREIRLDYEILCAGLICPTCGFEPIKVGHGADCPVPVDDADGE